MLRSCVMGMAAAAALWAQSADLVVHSAKVVTVDAGFRVAQAFAVRGDRVVAVGTNAAMLRMAGPKTERVDAGGRVVLPGLADTHVHAGSAALYEFDHTVPDMETVEDVLHYVGERAKVVPEGAWIRVSQVFITRLRDQRFPTRAELDRVAPKHPVYFSTGPDASLNSLALQLSGIGDDFQVTDGRPCRLERDSAGKLTGIIRSCGRFVKYKPSVNTPSAEDRRARLKLLLADYNAIGITSIADRDTDDGEVEVYRQLYERGELSCRVFMNLSVDAQEPLEVIEARLKKAAADPLHAYNNRLWLRGIKMYLDGGMLTGSAFMIEPWGVSKVYSIEDPNYKGMRYIPAEKLYPIVRAAMRLNLQPTAHSVGDGAVRALVEAYERVDANDFKVRSQRPCVTHSNFMTPEAIDTMKRIGAVADLQPAWLWLDGATLKKQFGDARLSYFQPYKTLFEKGVPVGGGSDHMQKIGSMRSINPYNPFLGMWITLTRRPRWMEGALHPEQIITREQAIRFYTMNNAFLTFEEKEKGSIEKGKLADFIVLDRDILTCPVDDIKDTRVLGTYVGGRQVYSAESFRKKATPAVK
ncbi:MAG: amidohydrolase [Bryobacteraceae bacterium]